MFLHLKKNAWGKRPRRAFVWTLVGDCVVEKEHSRHKALMAVLVRRVGGEKRREKEQRESKRAVREDDTSGSLGIGRR